jgi:hypothetical protein
MTRKKMMLMNRGGLVIGLLLGLTTGTIQAAPLGEGGDQPTPSAEQQGAQRTTVRRDGPLYSYPTRDAPVVGTIGVGDEVVAQEHIGDWYRVQVEASGPLRADLPQRPEGWVTGDLLDGPLDGVPPATVPTPTPTPVPAPTAPPAPGPSVPPQGVPGVPPQPIPDVPANERIPAPANRPPGSAGPGSAAGGGVGTPVSAVRQPVPISRPIIVQQCADTNDNTACDIGEGIAGVTSFVLNARTGQVLGQSVSDSQGIAQVYVVAMSDDELVVNVPYLAENQPLSVTNGRVAPILIKDEVGLPGLLP